MIRNTRALKIRAWDKIKNKMYNNVGVINNLVYYQTEDSQDIDDIFSIDNTIQSIDNVVLMLFTGLKDSYENDIYEHDIVECIKTGVVVHGLKYEKIFRSDIEFEDGCYVMSEEAKYNDTFLYAMTDVEDITVKVIGNIYTDRHLLDGYDFKERK